MKKQKRNEEAWNSVTPDQIRLEADEYYGAFLNSLLSKDRHCQVRGTIKVSRINTFAASDDSNATAYAVEWFCSDCPGAGAAGVKLRAPSARGFQGLKKHLGRPNHKVHNECANRIRYPPPPPHPPSVFHAPHPTPAGRVCVRCPTIANFAF